MKFNKKIIIFTLISFLLLGTVSTLGADYPSKDIKMICNGGVGGGTDSIVRNISSIAEKYLPASMYVVNVTGGSTASGPFQVMNEDPDGYTIGNLVYDSVVTAEYRELIPGYDLDKLEMIAQITSEADAFIVKTDSKWKNFQDLIDSAKENPGRIKVGNNGMGSRSYLAIKRVEEAYDVDFQEITYVKGSGPQKEALLAGEIDAVVTSLGDFASVLNSGEARGLAEMATERNKKYNVPTFVEMGHEDLVAGSFVIIAAPADTPENVVNTLEEAFYKGYNSDEFQNWLEKVGVTGTWRSGEELDEFIEQKQNKEFKMLDRIEE